MKNILLIIISALTILSCSALPIGKSKVGTAQTSISNTQWKLADNVQGKTPTLVIESGRVSGNAGCNNYFGELMLDSTAGNFSAKNIGSTKMFCDNMNVETNFLNMLQEANKYVVHENVLELYKNNLLLLRFNKQ